MSALRNKRKTAVSFALSDLFSAHSKMLLLLSVQNESGSFQISQLFLSIKREKDVGTESTYYSRYVCIRNIILL